MSPRWTPPPLSLSLSLTVNLSVATLTFTRSHSNHEETWSHGKESWTETVFVYLYHTRAQLSFLSLSFLTQHVFPCFSCLSYCFLLSADRPCKWCCSPVKHSTYSASHVKTKGVECNVHHHRCWSTKGVGLPKAILFKYLIPLRSLWCNIVTPEGLIWTQVCMWETCALLQCWKSSKWKPTYKLEWKSYFSFLLHPFYFWMTFLTAFSQECRSCGWGTVNSMQQGDYDRMDMNLHETGFSMRLHDNVLKGRRICAYNNWFRWVFV